MVWRNLPVSPRGAGKDSVWPGWPGLGAARRGRGPYRRLCSCSPPCVPRPPSTASTQWRGYLSDLPHTPPRPPAASALATALVQSQEPPSCPGPGLAGGRSRGLPWPAPGNCRPPWPLLGHPRPVCLPRAGPGLRRGRLWREVTGTDGASVSGWSDSPRRPPASGPLRGTVLSLLSSDVHFAECPSETQASGSKLHVYDGNTFFQLTKGFYLHFPTRHFLRCGVRVSRWGS